jgi:hypothetical protein
MSASAVILHPSCYEFQESRFDRKNDQAADFSRR